MNKYFPGQGLIIEIALFFCLSFPGVLMGQSRDVILTIHLRGVNSSKISLLALSESRTFNPILEVQGIKNGETTKLKIPEKVLPGEFVLRFDYKENESDTPYPSEKYIFINDQELELWVNPKYSNNPDSAWFQDGERENTAFSAFSKENGKQQGTLGLLQNFLLNYDDAGSMFYKEGIREYERRREEHNQWLKSLSGKDKGLFVSSLYCFQYVPETSWKGTGQDRVRHMIDYYFDGVDFGDSLLVRTSYLNKWMDNYVNLYGKLAVTEALLDSLYTLAGKTAIERARKGHPLVYGWMVDYFFQGYESNGISAGMRILEPYLNDPNCLTSKRKEIARRLQGMEKLVPGIVAPEIFMKDPNSGVFELSKVQTDCKYIVLLFWSAGCNHCSELVDQLYPWQNQAEIIKKIMVVTISLDETETEIQSWSKKVTGLKGWTNLMATDGIRSKEASDYFILSAPVMVLLDSKTLKIISLPNNLKELTEAIK